jgi:Arc/MetJ-type ribon-helix-helix transcriptional regulator
MKKKKRASEKELSNVLIPTSLYEKIEERIKGTGFTSVSNYVTYVLKELLAEEKKPEEPFNEKDEEKIRARLRALGYID